MLESAYRRLGKKTGAKRESPTGNPSPAPTRPHRTRDTTDQWRDPFLVARPIFENFPSVVVTPASNVQVTQSDARYGFCHMYKLILTILELKDFSSTKNVRSALQKSEVGGGNGAERRPPPGIQAQHPAPAPHASHARHDRSMAR